MASSSSFFALSSFFARLAADARFAAEDRTLRADDARAPPLSAAAASSRSAFQTWSRRPWFSFFARCRAPSDARPRPATLSASSADPKSA